MTSILNLDSAPENPVERILYLDGVMAAVRTELDAALQQAYYDARLQGMFAAALDLKLHPKKKALAWTRHQNEANGRSIWRWGDGF